MRLYENLMILHPDINEDGIKNLIGKLEGIIEKSGGKIVEIQQWGLRKLAYKIKKLSQGYYFLIKFAAPPLLINELERNERLWEECLRFITVKLEDEVDEQKLLSMERVHKMPTPVAEEEEEEESFAGFDEEEAEEEVEEESEDREEEDEEE